MRRGAVRWAGAGAGAVSATASPSMAARAHAARCSAATTCGCASARRRPKSPRRPGRSSPPCRPCPACCLGCRAGAPGSPAGCRQKGAAHDSARAGHRPECLRRLLCLRHQLQTQAARGQHRAGGCRQMHRLQILRLGLPLRHLRADPQQLLRAQNPLRVDGREPGSGTGQGLLLARVGVDWAARPGLLAQAGRGFHQMGAARVLCCAAQAWWPPPSSGTTCGRVDRRHQWLAPASTLAASGRSRSPCR